MAAADPHEAHTKVRPKLLTPRLGAGRADDLDGVPVSKEPESELYQLTLVYVKLLNCLFAGLDIMLVMLLMSQK
jgi:hypothetical protein